MRYFIRNALFLVSIISVWVMYPQKITVYDAETFLPVSGVSIHQVKSVKNVLTGDNGQADIGIFDRDSELVITRLSYEKRTIGYEDLARNNFEVFLNPENEQIETVVLTVSRSAEKRSRMAEHVEVIRSGRVRDLAPPTTAELLSSIPGIKVQKSQMGGGSPVLRGMEANRVLLVVDGVRMNNAIYRKGHIHNSITLSPGMLEKTEVLFGPSSIIYGSDALGGVIYYRTIEPKFKKGGGFRATADMHYASVNNELAGTATGILYGEYLSSVTAFSYAKFGDLYMGKNRLHGFDRWALVEEYSGNTPEHYEETPRVNPNPELQRNTGYSQKDFLQKFIFKLPASASLTMNFQYSESSDIPRFDKLTERTDDGELKYAEWYYGPQKRFMSAAKISLKPGKKWMKNGDIILAYQNVQESRHTRRFGSLDKYDRDERVRVFSVNGDFHVPIAHDEKRILSYGFEMALNDVKSTALGRELDVDGELVTGTQDFFPILSRYPDGGSVYNNYALYGNIRLGFGDKSTLNTGLRYTYTRLHALWRDNTYITLPRNEVYLDNSAFSGTFGYSYKPSGNWQLNAVLSTGFRSPNIDDVGKIREKKGKVSVPNVYLKPEYAINSEIGLIRFMNGKKVHLESYLYYTLLHRYITRDYFSLNGEEYIMYDGEPARIIANVNKGDAYIYGGTVSISARWDNGWKFMSSHTYTYGRAMDTGEPLSSIPPLFGHAELMYRQSKWKAGTSLKYNLHKPAELYNLTEGIDNLDETPVVHPGALLETEKYYGSPAWWTIGLHGKYRITDYLELNMRLDNLLDVHYKEFASGISAPGRNFSVSALWRM